MAEITRDPILGREVHLDQGETLMAVFRADPAGYWRSHAIMALAAGVPTAEQELVLLLLRENVLPILLSGDVRFVDLGVVGEGGHRIGCGCLLMVVHKGAGVNLPRGDQWKTTS